MKIALDLDGTAWLHRKFFIELMKGLQAMGHEVGILTAHNERSKEEDIKLFKARGFPTPDFYYAKKADGSEASIPSTAWKPRIMEDECIDYLLDDYETNIPQLIENRDLYHKHQD